MDRDAAVARIQQGLGFRSDKAAEIVTALQDAQIELELRPTLPWFLKEPTVDITTVADTATVAYPTDFIMLQEDGALHYFDSSADTDEQYTKLKHGEKYQLRAAYQSATGVPAAYHNEPEEQQFRFFPIPDDAYTIRIEDYYKKDSALSAGSTENNWLIYAHEWLIGRAGRKIALGS